MQVKIKVKFVFRTTLVVFLLFTPASLGESGKPDHTAPIACDGEMVLTTKLEGVKTPRALREKIKEGKKLVPQEGPAWVELSRIARDANASHPNVATLKSRLASVLQRCTTPVSPDEIDVD